LATAFASDFSTSFLPLLVLIEKMEANDQEITEGVARSSPFLVFSKGKRKKVRSGIFATGEDGQGEGRRRETHALREDKEKSEPRGGCWGWEGG